MRLTNSMMNDIEDQYSFPKEEEKISFNSFYSSLIGRKFGNRTIIGIASEDEKPKKRYACYHKSDVIFVWCKCDCGSVNLVPFWKLRRGEQTSCIKCKRKRRANIISIDNIVKTQTQWMNKFREAYKIKKELKIPARLAIAYCYWRRARRMTFEEYLERITYRSKKYDI